MHSQEALGLFERILDMIMGVRLISKEDALEKFQSAINECDADEDGYLSVRELIRLFKKVAHE